MRELGITIRTLTLNKSIGHTPRGTEHMLLELLAQHRTTSALVVSLQTFQFSMCVCAAWGVDATFGTSLMESVGLPDSPQRGMANSGATMASSLTHIRLTSSTCLSVALVLAGPKCKMPFLRLVRQGQSLSLPQATTPLTPLVLCRQTATIRLPLRLLVAQAG